MRRRCGSVGPPLGDGPAILGWDAAGTVVEVGPAVRRFSAGDEVWYAGAMQTVTAELAAGGHTAVAVATASMGEAGVLVDGSGRLVAPVIGRSADERGRVMG